MKKETIKAAQELLAVAMELNAPDYHVWCNFTGHVEWIEIQVMVGGWKKDCHPTFEHRIFLNAVEPSDHIKDAKLALIRDHERFREEQAERPAFLRRQAE